METLETEIIFAGLPRFQVCDSELCHDCRGAGRALPLLFFQNITRFVRFPGALESSAHCRGLIDKRTHSPYESPWSIVARWSASRAAGDSVRRVHLLHRPRQLRFAGPEQ